MDFLYTNIVLTYFSDLVGLSVPALKLLLSILSGYPLAHIYRKYILNEDKLYHHLYFIIAGICLGSWNYGLQIFHCICTIFASYCILKLFKGTVVSVATILSISLIYLLFGYYYNSTNSYDINWTMPYCIIVLRLTGVAFDLVDGQTPTEKLSKENQKVALKDVPTIFELFGHSLFPSGFLIGPQFPMKRYQDFVDGKFCEKDSMGKLVPPDSIPPAKKTFQLGVFYLIVHQVLAMFVSDDLMVSEDFANINFLKRMFLLGVWGRYTLYKYISCWLLTEGACILFGLSYNGVDENGKDLWDGVSNVNIGVFENCTEFNHYIKSFNTNTNHWVAQYVFKRLKFLGNRYLSQFGALLFLAIWHGLHSGYYICFLFEFIVMYMERDIQSIVKSNKNIEEFFNNPTVKTVLNVILRVYTFVFMGWCLLPFALLKFDRYWTAFANVNYAGIVLFCFWPIIYAPLIRFFLKNKKTD